MFSNEQIIHIWLQLAVIGLKFDPLSEILSEMGEF